MVDKKLLSLLVCPECRGSLSLVPSSSQEGALECSQKHHYPIRNSIPRLVVSSRLSPEERRTQKGFDLEWRKAGRVITQEKIYENRKWFERIFDCSFEECAYLLRGKLFLDAGCGGGRYSRLAQKCGAEVVALDFSAQGVEETSQRAQSGLALVRVVQASILDMPFCDASFDVVFSIGVIHHTGDIHRAFQHLVRVLKPGGLMVLGVYRYFAGIEMYQKIREFSSRLPPSLLYTLAHIAIPLSYIPRARLLCYPWVSPHDHWKKKVVETYDYYHPPFQDYHREEEIWSWFEKASCFENIRRSPFGNILAIKKDV